MALDKLSITANQELQNRMDDLDPMICRQAQLQQLINDAPEPFVKGYLSGIFAFRQQLSILTNRSF
jgi:hypothetical protein